MKKCLRWINYLFLILSVAAAYCYDRFGGLTIKTLNASVFMGLGLINSAYAWKTRRFNPVYMLLALAFCMAADVTLWFAFIPGAALFAVGHVFYFVAFCKMEKFRAGDLIPGAALFVPIGLWMLLWQGFNFGGGLMQGICLGYALIISLMFGKAAANYLRTREKTLGIIALGSAMFVFSDFMLLLNLFAGAPHITDTLCLFTYFPGQCVQAYAIYRLTEKEQHGKCNKSAL